MQLKRSTLAGTWYPSDAETLGALVDRLLAEAPEAAGEPLAGVIVPHAGYQYSGAVAAAAYRAARAQPWRRAVILAPSHRHAYAGIAVLDADAFETPLGRVAIDPAWAAWPPHALVRRDPRPFRDEHALEIQLPFVQRALPGAAVVPLLVGDLEPGDAVRVAALLAALADDDTLFIVSSDFTHYGARFGYEPFPAVSAAAVRAALRALDFGAIEPIRRGDAAGFRRYVADTGATICGRAPIAAFLTWAGPLHPGRLLAYQTSLDVTGDYAHCVSYAAIAFGQPSVPAARA